MNGLPRRIRFDGNRNNVFSNHSSHPIRFEGRFFPTAATLYRFLEHRHMRSRPGMRDGNVVERLRLMDVVLYEKFMQHPYLRHQLINTGNAELINTSYDPFWGCGANGRGYNELGNALMRLRDNLPRPSTSPNVKKPSSIRSIKCIEFDDNNEEYREFMNSSPFKVQYLGKTYPTAEHLFQCFKFFLTNSAIAERIRTNPDQSPMAARQLAQTNARFVRNDWSLARKEALDTVLSIKFQHPKLRSKLLGTDNSELVLIAPLQHGADYADFGKALMRLREKLRQDSGIPPDASRRHSSAGDHRPEISTSPVVASQGGPARASLDGPPTNRLRRKSSPEMRREPQSVVANANTAEVQNSPRPDLFKPQNELINKERTQASLIRLDASPQGLSGRTGPSPVRISTDARSSRTSISSQGRGQGTPSLRNSVLADSPIRPNDSHRTKSQHETSRTIYQQNTAGPLTTGPKTMLKKLRNMFRRHATPSSDQPRPPRRIFLGGEQDLHYGLTIRSPHPVTYHKRVYPTGLHLFESLKFKQYPWIAEYIRTCSPDPHEAFVEAHNFATFARKDWSLVRQQKMLKVVGLKFTQHDDLRRDLLETGTLDLVEDFADDNFWGIGVDGHGQNEYGKALMRIRADLSRSSSI